MPGGSEEKVFCLDMAHMDLGPLSQSSFSTVDSIKAAGGPLSPSADGSLHHSGSTSFHCSGSNHVLKQDTIPAGSSPGAVAAANGSLYATHGAGPAVPSSLAASTIGEHEETDEGTQHSALSYMNSLERVAVTGDRSTHLTHTSSQIEDAPALQGRFKKTLSLRRSNSGLVVGSYVLEPSDDDKTAGRGWLNGITHEGRVAERQARSVHGGVAFFREATVKDSSTHKGAACNSRTVHGGTAHAAAQGAAQPGGIFYRG